MAIAAEVCVFTNDRLTLETLDQRFLNRNSPLLTREGFRGGFASV